MDDISDPDAAEAPPRRRRSAGSARFSRRRLAWVFALAAAAASLGLAQLWRRQDFWRRRSETLDERGARLERMLESRSAEAERRRRLEAASAAAPQRAGELLRALASSASPDWFLESVAIDERGFVVRGRWQDASGDPLRRFRAGLAGAGEGWRLDAPAEPAAPPRAGDPFAVRGQFEAPPPLAPAGPLPPAGECEAWLDRVAPRWSRERTGADAGPELELRRYLLTGRDFALDAWPAVVETVRQLCGRPGVSLERVLLEADAGSGERFRRAEIALTARLRP